MRRLYTFLLFLYLYGAPRALKNQSGTPGAYEIGSGTRGRQKITDFQLRSSILMDSHGFSKSFSIVRLGLKPSLKL